MAVLWLYTEDMPNILVCTPDNVLVLETSVAIATLSSSGTMDGLQVHYSIVLQSPTWTSL